MQFVSPNYNGENGVKKIRLTEENFSQKLYLVSIAIKKDPIFTTICLISAEWM